MKSRIIEKTCKEILSLAGIEVNGPNPWDIQINNNNFFKRALTEAELGIGESYMDGWWECEEIDELIYRVIRERLDEKVKRKLSIIFKILLARIINFQSKKRAFIIGERHYDLGNDLFQNMLDKRMNYSSAYWKGADNLDDAQENKLELICQKLYLQEGTRVLDIGCGWSAFGKYAAEKYNVETVGVTVSKEQVELGKEMCKGLPVEIRLQDYRELNEKFDCIVSVGMIEHVGYKNYKTYFQVANRCLKDDGLFLLHTIGEVKSVKANDAWTEKYIFPNSMLPSVAQLGNAIEGLFVMEDWHNFGADYDKTLMAWYKNFNSYWQKLKLKYDERFYRMWKYFLLSSAGAFRARSKNQLWQIVLSKKGFLGGYKSVR
ncbi:MAG: cyclopropane fatty acyl phospholipid synthase [Ignavibacteriaceae bacterium]|nr:cyclopropane fatty acyl phospholipid synthase [Ignavibacteriaceae bacterium]